MSEVNETIQGKEKFVYIKEGPKLREILDHPIPRNNELTSIKYDETSRKRIETTFTEKEGIANLKNYIEKVNTFAIQSPDQESQNISQLAKSFEENIVFLGEHELQEAVHGIAQHIIDIAQKGKTVYLYPYQDRSPQYITLRILEEIDSNTEEFPEIRNRIKLERNASKIAKECVLNPNDSKIVVPDDFALSGTKIRGGMGRIYHELIEKGIEPDGMIEATLVATPIRNGVNLEGLTKYGTVFSYYGIPEVKNPNGGWMFDSGVALTGSWCSADYGFQTTIGRLQSYTNSYQENLPYPYLFNIKRPYEKREDHQNQYADLELQKRWEKIERKYSLTPKKL
jgi:hypothetical protein